MVSSPGLFVVVQQQAHAHAAVACRPQRVEQQRAGAVVVPDEVLRVERALGAGRELQPHAQRVAPVRQRQHAVQAGPRAGQRVEGPGERRVARVLDVVARGRGKLRQRRARAQRGEREGRKQRLQQADGAHARTSRVRGHGASSAPSALSWLDAMSGRELPVAIIGCNLAWGIFDAVLYLVGELCERKRRRRLARRDRDPR